MICNRCSKEGVFFLLVLVEDLDTHEVKGPPVRLCKACITYSRDEEGRVVRMVGVGTS